MIWSSQDRRIIPSVNNNVNPSIHFIPKQATSNNVHVIYSVDRYWKLATQLWLSKNNWKEQHTEPQSPTSKKTKALIITYRGGFTAEREREREYVHSLLYCSCYNQKRSGKTWINQNVLQPPIERYCFINVSKNHQSLRKKKHSQKKIMIIILTHHVGGNCKLLARGARRTMNQNWRALGRW